MTFEAVPQMDDSYGPFEFDAPDRLTASMVDDMPVGQIMNHVLGSLGPGILAMKRYSDAQAEGRPHQFLTANEAAQAKAGVLASRRGRPVGEDTLRRVAEIVKDGFGYRGRIRDEFFVSTRTASRWVDARTSEVF